MMSLLSSQSVGASVAKTAGVEWGRLPGIHGDQRNDLGIRVSASRQVSDKHVTPREEVFNEWQIVAAFTQECFSHRPLTLSVETVKLSITKAGEWWRHEAERG